MAHGLGLEDAYGATLGRIKGQGGEKARLGVTVLMWISHSERPLKADELCRALAVEIGLLNLHADNVPSIGTLLACCQGLIVVEKEASMIRLVHFTLHEYLRAHPDLFNAAHSTMAETCLTYLNSQQVKASSTSPSPDLQDTPFLEYASLYWGVHAKKDLSDCAKLLALRLFGDYNSHISTKILLKAQNMRIVHVNKFSGFSGLHCASFFGVIEIVARLIEMEGCDINQMDSTGGTLLHWAAWSGHEGVVETLLRRDGASPDKPNNSGQTPLLWAAYNGYEGVVETLLGRDDVNPANPDNAGQTPLHCAAWNGHEGMVKMLLGRDGVTPDGLDNNGRTPLWLAAGIGHEGVVKILLGRGDVNPDKADDNGRTPLSIATWNGEEDVVKILLERGDVNPDKSDNDGCTPLWGAAQNGHGGVVKILLGRGDVYPDKPDNIGRTPLFIAACYGHEGVVKMLLERGVNPDKPNINGRTPLYLAAWNGQERVMKILLERDDVDPNKLDKDGKTSLDRATEGRHKGAMALLRPPESPAPSLS